ncbi:hypothetical protein F2Q69_00030970 [Brassica cretica]|uniref:Uncharacterized protein n=1 Tax=Brassica cretica TaxID=69181 RepID=A0A8S9SBB9_BRACR|nr:hypothetical protein F2Q69_00030970 [Brassica cretica]
MILNLILNRLPVELSSFVLSAGAGEEFFKEAGQVVDVRFGMSNDGDGRLIADLTHALEFHGRPLLGRQMRLEVSQQRGQRHTYTPQSSSDMEHGISFLTL